MGQQWKHCWTFALYLDLSKTLDWPCCMIFPNMLVPGRLANTRAMQLEGLKDHLGKGNRSNIMQSPEACLFVGPHSLYFYAIHYLEEGMNSMLTTVPEMTKLGGVISFDKWPGYE